MIVTDFPRRVRELENVFIPLSDGTRLAARIFLPEDAGERSVPAILEYLPYRKRDGTVERDARTHPYLAGHGYAAVRVDIRGTGESGGVLTDEYALSEQDDCLQVIAWLAAQEWCSGAVGMMGISWGGFNGLQVAARQPPALKAVLTLCSTDDRYTDDVHFMGGALLTAKLSWAMALQSIASQPPDPALVGSRWRDMWLGRLEQMPLFLQRWLAHQRRDAYWRHGSVGEDLSRITCPVYAVGGWTDAYTNAIPRLLAGLTAPCKGLIGPWAHRYPHIASPGPSIGFLQEALRWFDHWLKGIDTGIMSEPKLRVWMQESVRPAAFHNERPGRWIGEPAWPSPRITIHQLYLTDTGLSAQPTSPTERMISSVQTLGAFAGSWCPFGYGPDDAGDQRPDDALSVVFDTSPLMARTEILGAPVLELELSSDQPHAIFVARLCDVHPDGASTRVSYGILNLTHHSGHKHPEPLEPGHAYRVRLQLNDVAYAFPRGHRIRLALSTTYWPIIWPTPQVATLTLRTGAAALLLPVRSPDPADDALPPFAPPETAPPAQTTVLRPGSSRRETGRDIGKDEGFYRVFVDGGQTRHEATGLELGTQIQSEHRIKDDDPLSARVETSWIQSLGRANGWRTRTETRSLVSATERTFGVHVEFEAFVGEQRVFQRLWDYDIERDRN